MGTKRRMRRRATRRRWAARWLDSGMTAREFCDAHGLALSSLSRWTRDLRESRRTREAAAGFVEVDTHVAAPPTGVRLVVGSVTLELEQLPPAEYVAALGRLAC